MAFTTALVSELTSARTVAAIKELVVPLHPLIAIVDDDDSFRRALGNLVRALGYLTSEHCSAESFLDSESAAQAHCLIADVHMPGMSGLDLLARVRADQKKLPVILVTAENGQRSRDRAIRRGATEYFPKPLPSDQLAQCLSRLCRSKLVAG